MTEIFDIVNSRENIESQHRLFQLLELGAGVLFIGSGSSLRLKYPSWEGVLNDLSNPLPDGSDKELIKRKIEEGDLLLAAEIIKNKISIEDYNSKFRSFFEHKSPSHDNFHKSLVKLKFKGFITTNYDPVIEAALRTVQARSVDCEIIISETTKRNLHQFIKSLNSVDWEKRYHLYLHGKFNYPSTSILSYGDYVEKYDGINIREIPHYSELIAGRISINEFELATNLKKRALRTLHYNTIYLIMATQRIVYFGYGLRDPYLNKIVNDIQSEFHPDYDDFHFALMSSNTARNWNRDEYLMKREEWSLKGIELVFYQDNEKYTGIEGFVSNLSPDSFLKSVVPPIIAPTIIGENVNPKASLASDADETINENLRVKIQKTIEELRGK